MSVQRFAREKCINSSTWTVLHVVRLRVMRRLDDMRPDDVQALTLGLVGRGRAA